MIERLDPHLAAGAEGGEPHVDADTVPQRRQPGVVDLQDQPRGDDRLVFDAHRLGKRIDIVLVGLVVAIGPIDFKAGRRRRCQKDVVGSGCRDGDVDFLLELGLADIADRTGASLHRALLGDLRARRIKQRAAFVGVFVEIGKNFAVLALLDQRLAFGRNDVGEAAEAMHHIAQPIAALGVFAFIDDIDAGFALPRDNRRHVLAQMRVVAGRDAAVERKER